MSKERDDKTMKHRGIIDLRANRVNLAAATPERQVLPTPFQHGQDVAQLGRDLRDSTGQALWTLVLDVQDAFMGIPLAMEEFPFNSCALEASIVTAGISQAPCKPLKSDV